MSVVHALIRLHAPPTNHAHTSTQQEATSKSLYAYYTVFPKVSEFLLASAFPYYRKLNINILTMVWWDTGFMNVEIAIECENVYMWCTVYGA